MTPLVDLLASPTAIVGTTGAGKSYAAKGAVEELLRRAARVVIIDPTGAWYGLRSGADGKEGGFPVLIFGGDHADIEIGAESGSAIAEAIAGRQVQAIIDTSEMTGGEKTRFMTDFLQTLYARNKAALHLIVDEADEICPQNPMPEERRLSGAFDKIVRRGRIKGFRPLMITQRPAVLHKNVLSQVGTLVALKLTSPQDRKAIDDWVKGNADTDTAKGVMQSLPGLQRGEGWIWSPAAGVLERVTFPPISTFDSSRTPEAGEAIVAPAMTAVDVNELRSAVVQVEPKSAGYARGGRTSAAELAAAEQRGYERGLDEGIERGKVVGIALGLSLAQEAVNALHVPEIAGEPMPPPRGAPAIPAPSQPKRASSAPPKGVDPLYAVAMQVWPAKLSWSALAAACGRKARGGHFNSVRKRLIEDGLVREEGNLVVPTNPAAAPDGIVPADLLEEHLPQPAAKMFSAIRKRPGITIVGLASVLQMQPRGGHWNHGMSVLKTNGLIEDWGGSLFITPSLLSERETP